MKRFKRPIYALMALIMGFTSCKKENSLATTDTSNASEIAVAASESTSSTATSADTLYIVQPCARGSNRNAIAEASLPGSITTFLTSNYSGYTFNKAFTINNSSGTTTGYVVIIYYNDKPVGIEFDSSGNFVKVLEQREKGDLNGHGWHHGGRFEHRDGRQRDTVALNALPSLILAQMTANYGGDTLLKAFKNKDSSYAVVSKNNGLFATVFDPEGNFTKRVQLSSKSGNCQGIEQSALPASALAYLDNTYPNYVFKKAFSITGNVTVTGYVVLIDANNTKYALEFDGSGNFVKVKTIY